MGLNYYRSLSITIDKKSHYHSHYHYRSKSHCRSSLYHTLISVYKIKKFGEPEYFASHLNKENIYGRIIIPNCGLGLATKSFSYRGARQWNLLPASIRRATKISIFKKGLRRWIQANVPRFLD